MIGLIATWSFSAPALAQSPPDPPGDGEPAEPEVAEASPESLEDGPPVVFETSRPAVEAGEDAPRHRPRLSAGLTAATAYDDRGLDAFGATRASGAGLLAPTLEVEAGGWTFRWTGIFQAWGDRRQQLVRDGVGSEQDAAIGYSRALGDDVELDVGVAAGACPFADEPGLAIEPGVAATADLGLELTVGLLQSEVLGGRDESYTYAWLGVARSIELTGRAGVLLSATGGAKRWDLAPRARPNTWDLDLAGGFELAARDASIRPTVHLSWTDLPPGAVGAGAFAWAGVDATLGLVRHSLARTTIRSSAE